MFRSKCSLLISWLLLICSVWISGDFPFTYLSTLYSTKHSLPFNFCTPKFDVHTCATQGLIFATRGFASRTFTSWILFCNTRFDRNMNIINYNLTLIIEVPSLVNQYMNIRYWFCFPKITDQNITHYRHPKYPLTSKYNSTQPAKTNAIPATLPPSNMRFRGYLNNLWLFKQG